MRIPNVAVLAAIAMLCLGAHSASAAGNTAVYFVHGYSSLPSAGYNCSNVWGEFEAYMQLGSPWNTTPWTGTGHTVGYYSGDSSCNDYLGLKSDGTDTAAVATEFTTIDTLARRFATLVYNETNFGTTPVSVVAHSMGGLIVRRAIDGVRDGANGYPPTLNIRNVVTLSSPHGGYTGCNASVDQQCKDMNPTSSFFTTLLAGGASNGINPQTSYGTTWTLMGSINDGTVSYDSATAMAPVSLRLVYTGTSAPTHMGLSNGWLTDNDNAPGGTPVTRYADAFAPNVTIPSPLPAAPAYDHWMKVTTAKVIQ